VLKDSGRQYPGNGKHRLNREPQAATESKFSDDSHRLQAIHSGVLALEADPVAFDRLTRLASQALKSPVAIICILNDKQLLIKSRLGFPTEWDAIHPIPTAGTLCTRVLKTGRPLLISDVNCHKQYRDLIAFEVSGAASYACVPLITADGHPVGAFYVADRTAREWTEHEIAILSDLAGAVVSEIELYAAQYLYEYYLLEVDLQRQHNLTLRERQYETEERLLHLGFDETARERAESALKQIENILEGITDGFFALDQSLRFTYLNDRAEKLLHRTRGELIDTRLTDHPTPSDLVQKIKEVQKSKSPLAFEFNDITHGAFFEILAYPSATGISVYFHDVTARKKAVDNIEIRSLELQALSRRLVEVQEEERGKIARELHDEVGQILTGLKLTLSAAKRLPEAAKDAQLDQAQQLVNELIGHVRDLSLDLRPAMLDDLGLLPALLWHFDRYTMQTGIEIIFHPLDIDVRFDQAVETAAYRIVQEALTNVARYAQVKEASVSVHNLGDALYIEVQDDGVGFDPERAIWAGKSNGVTGMRERVHLLRGEFRIDSVPGEGAVIRARIPFPSGIHGESDTIPVI
jgi:signal transduction histidine kinase